MTTLAEKRHLNRVASLPCGVCEALGPSCVHHIREGQGMSQRANHFLTVPLCHECHQGKHGIHGDRSAWRLRKLTELDVLADTFRQISETF